MGLKAIRESKGIKAGTVAQHIGVSRQTYSKYEASPENMTIAQARAVCDFIGVELDDIFLP